MLDEPLSSLDPLLKRNLTATIREIKEKLGVTIIYVTHNIDEIKTLADRVILMKDGRTEQEGKLAALMEKPETEFVKQFINASVL